MADEKIMEVAVEKAPAKRGRKPKEVLKEVHIIQNETIPQINKQEESVTKKVTQTDETNTQSKLMFNF